MKCLIWEIIRLLKQCIVIGCGSHATSVISIIEAASVNYSIAGLVDIAKIYDENEEKSGYKVFATLEQILAEPENYFHFECVVAIGDNRVRSEVFEKLKSKNFKLPSIISNHAFVDRTVVMGEGNVISHGAVINAKADLGNNNIINTSAVIEHDCLLSNHIHIAPKAVLCGGVKIEDFVMVGVSATVVPDVDIAMGSILGAGAVLVESIKGINDTYLGVPARIRS